MTTVMATISCSSCEATTTQEGARYCGHCGTPLPAPRARLTPAVIVRLAGKRGAYYVAAFERMFPTGAVSFKPSWNWAAAFVPGWMLYRRLWGEFVGLHLVGMAASLWVTPPLGLAILVLQGLFGNAVYLRSLERRAARETRSDARAHQYA